LISIKKYIPFIFLFLVSFISFSQNSKIDSLKQLLVKAKDTLRIDVLNQLTYDEMYSDPANSIKWSEEAYLLADSLNDIKRKNTAASNLGILQIEKGNYKIARKYYNEFLEYSIKKQDSINIARAYGNIGNTYYREVVEDKALENYWKALNIFEALNNENGIAMIHATIGNLYLMLDKYDEALEYYKMAYKIFKKLGKKGVYATTSMNIGIIYKRKKLYENAILYFSKAYKTFKELGYKRHFAQCLANIGDIYLYQEDYNDAINEYSRALAIFKEYDFKEDIILCISGIGKAYNKLNKPKLALEFFKETLQLSKELNSIKYEEGANYHMYSTYKDIGDYKNALLSHEEYLLIHDSIYDIAEQEKLSELITQFETEKKEKKIELLNKDKKLQKLEIEKNQAQINKQRIIIYVIIIGIILILIFFIVFYKQFCDKKKKNIQLALRNEEISQQKEEIETQKDEIESQRDAIFDQNKDITDSIEYAKRIQTAMLPVENDLHNILPESFILFLPRDIVSGDFYWFHKFNNKIIIAAADCTGHGVPGAFMSLIGITFLNEIVIEKNILKPSDILDLLRKNIIDSLHQTKIDYNKIENMSQIVKDGMDISVCTIDTDNNMVEFAGAHNHLYIIRNNELEIFKADRMPVSVSPKQDVPFTNHKIKINKDDILYLFSDGYIDQFGGEYGHKLKSKNFKKLLLEIHNENMKKQKKILENNFNTWKGNLAQLDDILIIGLKIN